MDKKELELFRLFPLGRIDLKSIEVGSGDLKCGSYQFSFRLINSVSGKSTKFSLFTNPIAINSVSPSGDQFGPLNVYSNKAIVLSISCTSEELNIYDNIEIGVLENNSGQILNSQTVSILQRIPITGTSNEFIYSKNTEVNQISLAEVAIDDAPIKTFKTLSSKNNKLVGGNIKYKSLVYDNGLPYVLSGSIVTRKTPIRQSSDKSSSESRGYFSDEVYRYYVSFWDEYGDFSRPIALNMKDVVGNTASFIFGNFKDMKFPKRGKDNQIISKEIGDSTETIYANNNGLNLRLTNIPSWAKGCVVLRAKRNKNILFQSPIIPTTTIQSPDAYHNYPGEGAQAPTPLGIIAPKDMYLSLNKAIIRYVQPDTHNVEWAANYDGFGFNKKIHVAFPPELMFNNSGVPYMEYSKNSELFIETVDYCRVTGNGTVFSTGKMGHLWPSRDGNRAMSSSFNAPRPENYGSYLYSSDEIKNLIESTGRWYQDEVVSFNVVPSNIDSFPIIGLKGQSPTSDFGAYKDMEISPPGSYNGTTPSIQKCVVFTTSGDREDLSYSAVNGEKSGYNTTNIIHTFNTNSNSIENIEASSITDFEGEFSNGVNPYSVSYVEIVNFKKGLNDDRYGDIYSNLELVSTGAYATFDEVPEYIDLDVFGGDCYISPFTFKVHDSHYSMTNSRGWGDDGTTWNDSPFKNGNGDQINRPFPIKGKSASIGLYLESEVNSLFSEEFLSQSRNTDKINSFTVDNFAGSVTVGGFYSYGGKYYRSLKNNQNAPIPGSVISDKGSVVTNIGYDYIDLGKSIADFFYFFKNGAYNFNVENSYTESRQPFNYLYNPEYSFENKSKPFPFVYSNVDFDRTNFSSRIIYSDTKILQTNIDGFSRFRVANIFDLEENRGAITRIVNSKGRLYGIQEHAFAYIPFEASQIETADGTSLAIQSGNVIGTPQYVDDYGSSYIRSIQATPYGIVFVDHRNSKIVSFSGSVAFINDIGVSKYIEDVSKSLRGLKISDSDVQSYYDYNRNETSFKFFNEALVLDNTMGTVKSILLPPSGSVFDYGTYSDSYHTLIGSNNVTNKLMITRINSDESNRNMLGQELSSSVTFVVNPDFYYTKMFYVVKFITNSPTIASIEAFSNDGSRSWYQNTTEPDRRAGFLLNKIRDDDSKRRVRGEYAIVSTNLSNNSITSVFTKHQASSRII